MLLAGVAQAVGLLALDWQPPIYSAEWHLHRQEEVLLGVLEDLGCAPVPLDTRQAGDILVFQYGKVSSHCAILVSTAPDYIVHAHRDFGKVIHQRLAGDLLIRLRQCYRFPGVTA